MAVEWIFSPGYAFGDLPYYWDRTRTLALVGMEQSLPEYPTPTAWMLTWPQALGGGSQPAYVFWFVTLILLADLGFCLLIWLSDAPFRGWAIVAWSLLLTALGPLMWLRFDLLPAVAVGAAALLAARRPAVAGGLLAVGAALKLWPAVLLPLLLNRPGGSRRRAWLAPLAGFCAVGIAVVVASVLGAGWVRLLSPLRWQADRGLQIESVPATALMALRARDTETWSVSFSQYQAFEIFGPGVAEWLLIADVLGVLGILGGVALMARHLVGGNRDRDLWAQQVAASMLAIIGLFIVVNKTLSPQYIIWLAGPAVALVAWRGLGDRVTGRWTATVLAIAGLSHLVYPVLYGRINAMADDPVLTPIATVVLIGRNSLLVALTVDVAITTWLTPRSPRAEA